MILDQYVEQRTTPITLRQLLFYERHMNTERLLISANYVRKELPIRISHRIREFQKLPFIVGTNPHIQQVYDLYWRAFERLRKVPTIKTLADNEAFCNTLIESLEQHLVVIPRLALGISECGEHMGSDRIDRFMQATLRSRISRRVMDNIVGVGAAAAVFSSCSARDTVAQCTSLLTQKYTLSPTLELDGDEHVVFTYHSDHIKYIIYQLLSNAFRHTIQAHQHISSSQLPPIRVTICSNENDVLFRISDQGGGIPSHVYRHIWSYGHLPRFNTLRTLPQLAARIAELKNDQFIGTPPLGIGLPMSRVYAEYWGGDINVVSMPGWGTDAYVRIPRFGTQNENLDICSPYDSEDQRPIHRPHSLPRRLVV
ncbi:alpha-ketoacid dehydrogenase kinase [Lichtheimia hyalospora FSU 10163]|nr:alpha-ketoacid dehydrogenase kinase [Lichtheimia hyalospora FSU 10163]